MTVQAVCIDPQRVREVWPVARPMIEAAMKRGGLTDYADVENDVLSGESHTLLWLVWDSKDVLAAAVTQMTLVNHDQHCTILACGGSGKDEWMHLIGDLERYAKNEGCKSMRIWGRKGWERELPTYKPKRVMLEKVL